MLSESQRRAIGALPTADDWPDLDARELDRREQVLWGITQRIMEDGPHRAKPSAERGRQFIPFAALRGYDEMIAEVERRSREGD